MNHSEQLHELATALSAAQGEIEGAKKDSDNPFFKSRYADLASVWEACREALSKHGLAVAQFPETDGAGVRVVTILMHSSGQWLASELTLPVTKDDAQGYGSAVTYGRRYALAAAVGVAPEDDDGEAAVGRSPAIRTAARSTGPQAVQSGAKPTSLPAQRQWWALMDEAIRLGLYDDSIRDGNDAARGMRHSTAARHAGLPEWPAEPTTFHWAKACEGLQKEITATGAALTEET